MTIQIMDESDGGQKDFISNHSVDPLYLCVVDRYSEIQRCHLTSKSIKKLLLVLVIFKSQSNQSQIHHLRFILDSQFLLDIEVINTDHRHYHLNHHHLHRHNFLQSSQYDIYKEEGCHYRLISCHSRLLSITYAKECSYGSSHLSISN